MAPLIPSRFLFRFAIPVHKVTCIPRKGSKTESEGLLNLPSNCALPDFSEFDQQTSFAEIRLAWNEAGLGISAIVNGRKTPPAGNPENSWSSDSLHLWIDTRNTQTIHRAGRFCHHFAIVPTAGKKSRPGLSIRQWAIPRAREESPLADPETFQGSYTQLPNGYRLDAWIPAAALQGFDPDSYRRLGFYYYLRDSELGEQFLSVNQEFPFATDPSLWWTLELTS